GAAPRGARGAESATAPAPTSAPAEGAMDWPPTAAAAPILAPRPGRAALALTFGVAAGAAVACALAAPGIAGLDPLTLLLPVGLVALAETGALELFDRSSYSVGAVPILAAALLLGAPGAVLGATRPSS